MAAADPQASFFLTPPPRHLAELRIDTAPSAVAFSAPCGAARGKRRCLVPASSVRKRMLLELAPFDFAPAPSSSTLPPPPTPSPSPTASSAAPTPPPSPAREFSFHTAPRMMLPPASPGNIFAFVGNAAGTPGGSEARSGLSFSAPLGQQQASGAWTFLAPTTTGPTANGGFVFAAPPPETPTSTTTSGGSSFLASPSPRQQPLTPMGSTATGGFAASSVPSLIPLKPARNDFFAFPSPGLQIGSAAPSAAAKEPTPLAGLAPLPPRNPGGKMPSLFLRRAATRERRESLREQKEQQQLTPPPSQKVTKTNASDARSFTMSASSASPCSTFFTSPSKEAAKQEAKKVFSEASQSPEGSRCSSPARSATPEKENKQEQEPEVEVSSSPREPVPESPRECSSTSPAVFCSGAEVVVRVTCKCGVHKEFCFDHRL